MFFGRKVRSGMRGYNFTEEVRQVLSMARSEAARLRHEYVGTEHLLLGLIAQPEGAGPGVLSDLGVQTDELRGMIEEIVKRGKTAIAVDQHLPYTSRSKKVLELSMSAARNLGDDYVGAEHLLLGLIHEGRGIAAQVLADRGVTAERAGTALLEMRGVVDSQPKSEFRFEIDDQSKTRSVYEQIVEQAKEAVATGKLTPGDRLPTVRQLADHLDIAPGTVARAYSELERLGVVITEGKRGTRVAGPARPVISDSERPLTLVGLMRPVVVAAFHLGATAPELRQSLDAAMKDIFTELERGQPPEMGSDPNTGV
jgi:DNA-binding transcriptional regulator YhcF (GntR family)